MCRHGHTGSTRLRIGHCAMTHASHTTMQAALTPDAFSDAINARLREMGQSAASWDGELRELYRDNLPVRLAVLYVVEWRRGR
jgi:hypothetical protein